MRMRNFFYQISTVHYLALKGSSPNFASNINPLSANPTKWSNTLKQFLGKLATNCLSEFDHFVKLALKGLREFKIINKLLISVKF